MIAAGIYLLCMALSLACAVLLLRSYARSGVRLLLWSGICFVCLCINNVLLIVDMLLIPTWDLSTVRLIPALAGLAVLCYGLIWDAT